VGWAVLLGCAAPPPGFGVGDQAPSPTPPCRSLVAEVGSGVDFEHRAGPPHPPGVSELLRGVLEVVSAGVVAADPDGDGASDLFFPQITGENALYWGRGDGTFARGALAPDALRAAEPDALASAADFDGDGLLDLLVAGYSTVALLHNQGDRTFRDVTATWGLDPGVGFPGASTWADYDGDGDLDLFLGGFVEADSAEDDGDITLRPDSLHRNEGDRFVEVPLPPSPGATHYARFRDLDRDGDPDLLVFRDFQVPYSIFENAGPGADGWVWIDRAGGNGFVGASCAMGAQVGDLNHDGFDDLWVSNIGQTAVASGAPDWSFVDQGVRWGAAMDVEDHAVSWSVLPFDLDGDGDPGVFVAFGPLNPESEFGVDREQPDRFASPQVRADGTRTFTDGSCVFAAPQIGNSRGAATADFNNDGTPDLVVAHIGGAPSIFLTPPGDAHRLTVALRDPSSLNPFAVGARVEIEAEGRLRYEEVAAGGLGTYSGSGMDLYFGLATASAPDRVRVRWPDGEVQTIEDPCGDCRLVVAR